MALIKTVRGNTPRWGKDCYLAENSTIVGDVVMGDQCSLWFNAVVRGDVNSIRIGDKVNIQDGVTIHCTYEQASTKIGDRVSIGHHAIVHGCTLEEEVLIGMGAIVMDHVIVRKNCLIAAGAVVLEGTECESGFIYAGTPAKKVKALEAKHMEGLMRRISDNYVMYASWYK